MSYLTLTPETLPHSHICCAFSDKKCEAGTFAKKDWLTRRYRDGWRLHQLDARAKVFVEYGPAATAWLPVEAPNAMLIGCFWVSGRYAGHGHASALLGHVAEQAASLGLPQIVTVAGRKKLPFVSDGKWFKRKGFAVADQLESGFELLSYDIDGTAPARFAECTRAGLVEPSGISVWYSDRCPYTRYHVEDALPAACEAHGLALHVHKIDTLEEARAAPTPATIFSLFLDGHFVTTDISACLPARMSKMLAKLRA